MKIYLVVSTIEFMEYVLKYNCENALISYNNLRRTKDKRNLHQKLWEKEKNQFLTPEMGNSLKKFKNVMVDSGAFSFMSGTLKKVTKRDIDKFVEGYGQWLRDNREYYNYFEEMDLDFLFPLDIVEEWRAFLEKCADRQSIPVWHINRGLDNWIKTVKDYNYVAVGGLVSGEITGMEKYANFLIDIAHENNCIVHGLGYTKTRYLKYIAWDSVDSATWLYGGKGGTLFLFIDGKVVSLKPKDFGKNSRINYAEFNEINAKSWCDYSKYIENYWESQKQEKVLISEEGV